MNELAGPAGDLVSALASLVERGGARPVPRRLYEGWPSDAVVLEDNYSIIAFWPYESVSALVGGWGEAQESLSQLVSSALPSTDSKAWETYLVLCVPEAVAPYFQSQVNLIRADMQRSRKLIVAIDGPQDGISSIPRSIRLRRAVAPLVGLQVENMGRARDPLVGLTGKLDLSDSSRESLEVAIRSYTLGRPIVETMHNERLRYEEDGGNG